MLKTTIIAIICFMMSLSAGASKLVMSHEDFILLTDREKDQYIIKLMEMSVELESRYARETAQYGFSKERFERYSKILNQLKSALFIPDAYADSRGGSPTSPTVRGGGTVRTGASSNRAAVKNKRTWEEMANDWNRLLSERRDNKDTCIFAGWISRTVMLNGKPTCTHPDFIDGEGPNRHIKPNGIIARESFAYPEPVAGSNCGKDDKSMIQCNPLIFGYKKESSKALLCVKAGDDSHNSSFNCMKAALKTDVNEADQDLPAKRLKFLRDKFSDPKNEQLFKDVWGFTYKTCLCPTVAADSKGNKTFSQGYQDYMRPHQTCYGLMEMMAETSASCTPQDKFPMSDTTIFKKLQEMIKRTGLTEAQAKDQYSSFLTTIKNDNPAEYQAVCGDQGLVVKPKEEVPVVPVVVPKEEVPVVVPPKDPKYACEAKCESSTTVTGAGTDGSQTTSTSYTCTFTVKDENDPAATPKFDTDPTEKPSKPEDKNVSVTNKIAGKDVTLSCPVEIKPKEVAPVTSTDPTLTTKIECQERTCKITAIPDGEIEGWAVKWNIKNPPQGETIAKDWETPTTPSITTSTTTSETPANKLEINQAKGKVEYEVCATLEKGEKKIPEAGSCQKVPALVEAPKPAAKPAGAPVGTPNANPAPPQVQIRGSSDTSAIGIK